MSNMRSTGGAHRRKLAAGTSWAALALAAAALPAGAAQAQDGAAAVAETSVRIDIPAQPLGEALRRFAEQTGIQLGYSTDLVAGKQSSAVSGTLSPRDALGRLLAGTGLGAAISGNTATISDIGAGDGERVTGAVRVEGTQGSPYFGGAGVAAGVNGINGSRDITATEGTGSFTSGALTIGSKVPQALKDVPQSISVLTSERLEQQNVTDFTDALRKLPGITVVVGNASAGTQEGTFYSRGFEIKQFQVDGGAPLLTTSIGFYPQIDMAQFDHIELLRGSAGLFNGYGEPSGTINLVRKKPLDHGQVSIEAQAGSWNNYRIVVDASSPLAFDGALRGRLVMSWQDNDHFYDVAKDNRSLVYGVVDFDASPSTLLTAGASFSRQDSVHWEGGLPRYQTGGDLGLPRSTSFVFPWNRFELETTEFFGSVEQRIGGEWLLKANATYNQQHNYQKAGGNFTSVNPQNNLGPVLAGSFREFGTEQFSTELSLSGAFEIFGQRQEITVGANRASSDGGGLVSYAGLITQPYQPYPGGPVYCMPYFPGACPDGTIPPGAPPIDVFDFDPYDPLYSEPPNPLRSGRNPIMKSVSTVAYMNLRLTAFDRLHLTTGLRWSRFSSTTAGEFFCTTIPTDPNTYPFECYGQEIGHAWGYKKDFYSGTDFSWPPAVNLSYDLTSDLTAYVGYTDIYRSQDTYRDGDLKPVEPITGTNWEAGLKWAPNDGKLNLSAGLYRTRQQGFASDDNADRYDFSTPDYPNGVYFHIIANDGTRIVNGQVTPTVVCCYVSDPNRIFQSEGIDLEVAGEIVPGWQLSASYNYSNTKYEGETFGNQQGKPFQTIQPKHLYKLWTSYDFGAAGHSGAVSGLTVSGGLTGRSAGYYSGFVCVNLGPANPNSGLSEECVSYEEPDYIPFNFTADPYAVFSARIDYRFSSVWSLAINLDNILDKTYYETVGPTPDSGNYYGTPRSVTATLRAKW